MPNMEGLRFPLRNASIVLLPKVLGSEVSFPFSCKASIDRESDDEHSDAVDVKGM